MALVMYCKTTSDTDRRGHVSSVKRVTRRLVLKSNYRSVFKFCESVFSSRDRSVLERCVHRNGFTTCEHILQIWIVFSVIIVTVMGDEDRQLIVERDS